PRLHRHDPDRHAHPAEAGPGCGRRLPSPRRSRTSRRWAPPGPRARRLIANQFGGSHAQRDVIDWTLTEAALRGGLAPLAEALVPARLAPKPHSGLNRRFLRRARGADQMSVA